MSGNAMDTLSLGTLETSPVAWAGGQGLFSCAGVMGAAGGPSKVLILENDHAGGNWQPSGDAILHSVGEQITFFLPACNIRARLNNADSDTNLTPYYS